MQTHEKFQFFKTVLLNQFLQKRMKCYEVAVEESRHKRINPHNRNSHHKRINPSLPNRNNKNIFSCFDSYLMSGFMPINFFPRTDFHFLYHDTGELLPN